MRQHNNSTKSTTVIIQFVRSWREQMDSLYCVLIEKLSMSFQCFQQASANNMLDKY